MSEITNVTFTADVTEMKDVTEVKDVKNVADVTELTDITMLMVDIAGTMAKDLQDLSNHETTSHQRMFSYLKIRCICEIRWKQNESGNILFTKITYGTYRKASMWRAKQPRNIPYEQTVSRPCNRILHECFCA